MQQDDIDELGNDLSQVRAALREDLVGVCERLEDCLRALLAVGHQVATHVSLAGQVPANVVDGRVHIEAGIARRRSEHLELKFDRVQLRAQQEKVHLVVGRPSVRTKRLEFLPDGRELIALLDRAGLVVRHSVDCHPEAAKGPDFLRHLDEVGGVFLGTGYLDRAPRRLLRGARRARSELVSCSCRWPGGASQPQESEEPAHRVRRGVGTPSWIPPECELGPNRGMARWRFGRDSRLAAR